VATVIRAHRDARRGIAGARPVASSTAAAFSGGALAPTHRGEYSAPATTTGEPEPMRNTLAAAAPLLAALLGGAPALAQAQATHVTDVRTVSDLAAVCDPQMRGVERLESIAYCQGFLTAAGQYHTSLHPAGGPRRPLFCVPNPAPSVAQSGLAFAAWARQNPQRANEPALDGLLRWAQSAYACPTTATSERPSRSGQAR
jgi:hypothetical protein